MLKYVLNSFLIVISVADLYHKLAIFQIKMLLIIIEVKCKNYTAYVPNWIQNLQNNAAFQLFNDDEAEKKR